MYIKMLAVTYLLASSAYTAFMPVPVPFPSCQKEDMEYFAYSLDHQRAVKICMEIDGWRFNYGPVADHKKSFLFIFRWTILII